MNEKNYWLDLFTGETWKEFQEAGCGVSGYRESKWATVKRIRPGDYLMCYLTGVMRWVGALEVLDKPYKSLEPRIWSREDFPCRMKVKPVFLLQPEEGIPLKSLKDELSYFKNMATPNSWTGHFRGSPCKEKKEDAAIIIKALEEAKKNPTVRPVDEKKLFRQPRTYPSSGGQVTIPDEIVIDSKEQYCDDSEVTHEEIQSLLLQIGQDLGLDLWVARNDRNREFNGKKMCEFKNIRNELPLAFDLATNKTIELIDVLWLKANAIVAAFEVEHSTSIYSGLLRMADLVCMQPNLNIDLYIVAPDSKRDKVIAEVNRKTFSQLPQPLNSICQYVSYSSLKDFVKNKGDVIKHLKPSILDEIAESCDLGTA